MQFLKTLSAVSVTFALTALGTISSADESGKVEYMDNCASCHGESGLGDGPLAELMTVSVPGLTDLSAKNDGVFPMLEVIHTVDGRQGTRGHGYPMPVWGGRFKASVEEMGPYSAEVVARGRILSLAYYLEAIKQ